MCHKELRRFIHFFLLSFGAKVHFGPPMGVARKHGRLGVEMFIVRICDGV